MISLFIQNILPIFFPAISSSWHNLCKMPFHIISLSAYSYINVNDLHGFVEGYLTQGKTMIEGAYFDHFNTIWI